MSFGQVLFIKFVLYLPEWASGDKNLCSTLYLSVFIIALYSNIILNNYDIMGKVQMASKYWSVQFKMDIAINWSFYWCIFMYRYLEGLEIKMTFVFITL